MNNILKNINIFILLPVIALNILGLLAIASTTGGFSNSSFIPKQIVFIIIANIVGLFILNLPLDFFKKYAYVIYGFGFLSLIYVHFFGHVVNNARSWIHFAPGMPNIQPSEFMKYGLILALGRFLMYRETYHKWSDLIFPVILTIVPMMFVLKQPDLGSALIYMPLLFTLLFALGFRFKKIILLMCVGSVMIIFLWNNTGFIKEYQKNRVRAFMDPDAYKEKEAYQLRASLLAIGDGGIFGKGYQQGTIHGFDKLPESHTDFIFAVICEDFGLIGGGLVFGLFLFLLYSLMRLLSFTKDPFALCVILGVTIIMFYQIAISMSVVLGLIPTTGVTLPLVSYGGSSILSNYIGVSLAMNASNCKVLQLSKSEFNEY
ncbi:MAG: hypothetical protein COA79_11560 [Planctomycetota bacterium]|nr:MAG: hypothetical protein COA79_11560 [Planctomycetota bacterium]